MAQKSVIVVGAGLAGLCCARTLQREGHSVQLYEASDGVGGRVRTDSVDGFLLDRGFQVALTAYPAMQQEIDFAALKMNAFDPGALVVREGKRFPISDPLRMPSKLLSAALSPLFPFADKLRVLNLRRKLGARTIDEIFRLPDMPLREYLRKEGFTDAFFDNFIAPFYGGIFLEREGATSVRMFAFVFKMLSEGQTAVPAGGMGEIGKQIAADLSPGTLYLSSPVLGLLEERGRIHGVRLADGQSVDADAVVLATDFDQAAALAGTIIPSLSRVPIVWRISTTLYFSVPDQFYTEKLILLFPANNTLVNNAALVSNAAPLYAPPGLHLLSATVLGDPKLSVEALIAAVRTELGAQFPESDSRTWHPLRVYRIRIAQFAQPSGIWERLPAERTDVPGLVLAGEYTVSSSLQGAFLSGQRAAQAVMKA